MRNRKNIKPFENFHNSFEYTNSTIGVNEGFFDMYTIQGIWDMESKMENSGKTAIIIDKDHKRGWFGESYWIFFRFNDGFEDNIKISSDAFQRCRVGDKVTVIYYPDGCRVELNR